MGSHNRSIGLALGALLLASCAQTPVAEDAVAGEPQRAAERDESADASIIVTGGRMKVGNLEARSQFQLGVVGAAPPPPPPAPGLWGVPYHDVGRDNHHGICLNARLLFL